MTKIKNTKKGMAKKTLSMSLVVAMLATSNVPVWAAEFSDGSDVAVTSEADTFSTDAEAPVVEDNVADATEGQATGDTWTVQLTNMPKEVEWGSTSTNVTVTVKDVDGKEIDYATPAKPTTKSGLKYVWKDAATGLALEEAKDVTATIATPATAFKNKESVGNQYVLYIFDEKGDWSYTSSALTVGAQDISKNTIVYKDENGNILTSGDRVYTGKETVKNAAVNAVTVNGTNIPFDIDYTGDLVNVGTVKVTAKPIDSKSYKGVVSSSFKITKANVCSDLVKSTLVTKEFQYTGDAITPAKTDINVTDKNTGDDLNDLVTAITTTTAKNVGDTATVTATVKAKDTTKNYVANTQDDITTADTFKVVARDLSTVKVTIKSMPKLADGKAYTFEGSEGLLAKGAFSFADANGKTLTLGKDIVVEGLDKAVNYGTYTVTIKPAKDNKNVTGQTTAQFSIFSQDISGATFSAAIPAQEYTGSQITPDVSKLKVVFETKDKSGKVIKTTEVDPADYSIEYGKNVNAKDGGEIYIVGKRTYEGSKATVKFTINKATVTDKDLKAAEYVIINKDAKAAKEYAPAIGLVVKAKNGATPAKEFTLTEGTDYTVSYAYQNTTNNNKVDNNIIATITLKKDGNFATSVKPLTTSTRIASPILKDSDIKMNKTSYEYTGAVIVPDFDVVVDGKTLKRDKDYEIDNVVDSAKVGTATVYIKGKGEYDAKVKAKATFEVTPASADKVVVKTTSTCKYDGTAHKPKIDNITVTLNGNDVKDQFDITSYGENINAGKGTLVLTPNKKNKGFTAGSTKTAEFDIDKADLSGVINVYDARGIAYTIDGNNKITKNGQEVSFDYDGTEKTFAKVTFVPTKDASKPDMKVTSDDYEIKYVNNVTGGGSKVVSGSTVAVGASIVVIAKGNYKASATVADNSTSPATTVKNVAAEANFTINSKLYFTEKEVTVTDAEYAGPNMIAEPTIVVRDGDKVLVKDKDYEVTLYPLSAGTAPSETSYTWIVKGKGVYADTSKGNYAYGTWKIVKKNVANLDVKVDLNAKGETVLTVMNGNLKVDNKDFDIKLSDDKKTATVSATKGNKYYVGSKEVTVGGEVAKVGAPVISSVKVVGNKATVILSGEADGATGYDYVISKANDTTTARVDVTKNQVKTTGDFNYVQQGTYYAYCHAWRRNAEGKKVFGEWSNIYPFSVSAITPAQPVITSVKAKGTTVTVTYTKAANAEGYDVVLGSAAKKVNGEYRPVSYGKLVKKNIKGNVVTATFKNVKKGTYYAGLHAFNKTSEDGKKVFSQWSNVKKVTVK